MNQLLLIIPAVIVYICIVVMFLKQGLPNKQILFGVTLPVPALEDPAIKQMQAEYKKSYLQFSIAALLTIAPLYLLAPYFSLAFIYLFLWIAAFLYTSTLPFKKCIIKHLHLNVKRNGLLAKRGSSASIKSKAAKTIVACFSVLVFDSAATIRHTASSFLPKLKYSFKNDRNCFARNDCDYLCPLFLFWENESKRV